MMSSAIVLFPGCSKWPGNETRLAWKGSLNAKWQYQMHIIFIEQSSVKSVDKNRCNCIIVVYEHGQNH